MEAQSQIVESFKNQTIFLTGGSGFVGKVFLAKLLTVCPEVNTIYLLVRPKRNKTPSERLRDIFSFSCFEPLKSKWPNFQEKIKLIIGDCEKIGLDIAAQDREILRREVTIFLHAAANVKFDQSLKLATYANVRAMREVLALVKEMTRLKAFTYVSTVYSNCPHSHIGEDFYESGMKAESLLTLVESVDESVLDAMTPSLLKTWPNTYVFTKCISEDLLKREAGDLPVAVVRPCIIMPTAREPVPAWSDNFYGIIGICVGVLAGVIKVMPGKPANPLHVIPCDYVVNLIMASVWDLLQPKSTVKENKIAIYNHVPPPENTCTLGHLVATINKIKWVYPFSDMAYWFPLFTMVTCRYWYAIRAFFQHTLLAYFADVILTCLGRKPIAVQQTRKISKLVILLSYFTLNTWTFDFHNVEALWDRLSEKDQKLFRFELKSLNWDDFWKLSIKHGRQYLLKEKLEDLPYGRKKVRVLAVIHYATCALLLYLSYKILQFVFGFMF
ncbi:Putative fatty acyl-CoA reductase CG5065-like Protein [Tribolium castaneum]|uniref:Fatty acyl-CoA reductase n=1 Tax=Tribolium castaneum TaxID=7070 RepID=A0A139WEC2_TRICA|nr:PREDICTED: putative fatty acyl-CoA reductase CG5065 [Tribolium castaneum]KYB26274.1 Putative fatty acyl-CoA reductase CG5065-like Protein [Tribolium castaneum]|eukprot:XP_015837668.1 PREDICTED: putative fatty acyl-CoA reductase CG5065 [Tribolium castaneum]